MKTKAPIAGILLGTAGLLGAVRASALPTQEQLERSDIIFSGMVERVGEASFAGVPDAARAIVVKVERVMEKPGPVVLAPNSLVTVQVSDFGAWQRGQRATFYTEGWIYGDGVAVREVAHEPVGALAVAAGPEDAAAEMRSDAVLRRMVRSADAVAVGRVVAVRLAPRIRGLATEDSPGPVTEHDPEWQEAVVEVDSWMSGSRSDRQVVVRFPGSLDVAFYGLPKLRQGQTGTFLLQAEEVEGMPRALLSGVEVGAYLPLEVLPRDEAARVRTMLQQQ